MYIIVKKILKRILSPSLRSKLKTFKRRCRNYFNSSKDNKTTLLQLRGHLIDLGITAGDKIFVTSSFGNLNASFSPSELISMLQELVTENGLIVMPFYPKLNSYEWAKRRMVFDMDKTISGMGILTNVFSKMPNVLKSVHPTKAVCAWGNNAEDLVSHHELSTTPYYIDSPYGKLLQMHSKSLCLGLSRLPMFHSIEDIYSNSYEIYYQKKKYTLPVVTNEGLTIEVNTFVHDPTIVSMLPIDYIKNYCLESVSTVPFGYNDIVVIDNDTLKEKAAKLLKNNITRIIK